ncbi:MAG: hypothetical protein FD174_241 [Geobacteraceae bacterium]|nr:MAG: hypothetical protein FD174_241 [Geobacteraceae bacterium]
MSIFRDAYKKIRFRVTQKFYELAFCFTLCISSFVFLCSPIDIPPDLKIVLFSILLFTSVIAVVVTVFETGWTIISLTIILASSIAMVCFMYPQNQSFTRVRVSAILPSNSLPNQSRKQHIVFDVISTTALSPHIGNQAAVKSFEDHGKVVITFIGLIITILALLYGEKMKNLFQMDKKVDEISRLTIANAELALTHLPDVSESHQVSKCAYDTIKLIDNIVFTEGSYVLDYLDKIGNGATLRFSRAIKYYADGRFGETITELEDLIKHRKINPNLLCEVYYWLGIAYRQNGEGDKDNYPKSIKAFTALYAQKNSVQKINAKYGIALTLFSLHKTNIWYGSDSKYQNNVLNKLITIRNFADNKFTWPTLQNENFCLEGAKLLINDVLESNPFHYSAILYSILLDGFKKYNGCNEKPPVIKLTDMSSDEERTKTKMRLVTLLTFLRKEGHKNYNIKANYFVVEALVLYSLGQSKQIEALLKHAASSSNLFKEVMKNKATIFSDISIKQIQIDEFNKQIDNLKKTLLPEVVCAS